MNEQDKTTRGDVLFLGCGLFIVSLCVFGMTFVTQDLREQIKALDRQVAALQLKVGDK